MEYQLLASFPLLVTSLLFIFMFLKLSKKSSKPNQPSPKLPPGPRKVPILGNILQFVGSPPHRRLKELAKKHGSLMHIQLGQVSHIVISSAESAKQVLKTHDLIFAGRPFVLFAKILLYNFSGMIFADYGEQWRQLRKLCVIELLSAKRVESFRSMREREVSNLISAITSSASAGSTVPVNLTKMLFSLTNNITARASFGRKCKDQDAFMPLVEEIIKLAGGFSLADFFPSIKLLHVITGMKAKLQRLHRDCDKIMENIIAEHKARTGSKAKSDQEDNLLDVLLRLQQDGNFGIPLTTDTIKAMILELFIAGSDTSYSTIIWTMSELLRHPRVMERAQAEVRKIYDKKGNVDETELHELKYLKLVIKETMRLHTLLPLLAPRECRESCEINGFDIPAKTYVIINAWAIARDPNYWDDPETFYPERFLDSSIDYKGTNFEYIPFGAGRRMCPGMMFGLANVELPLAQLLYYFDWKLPNGQKLETLDVEETFGVVLKRKNDLLAIPIPYYPQLS